MEKVLIPQFVADYIESFYDEAEPKIWEQADLIRDWDCYIVSNPDVQEWAKDDVNFMKFITAIVTNDYEVEVRKYMW